MDIVLSEMGSFTGIMRALKLFVHVLELGHAVFLQVRVVGLLA